jgi:hypothetical protein
VDHADIMSVEHIVERVLRRVVSESLDIDGLQGGARDVYTASSDMIEAELTNITSVIDGLATAVGSPVVAAKIINAYVSEVTYGDRQVIPDIAKFSMSRSAREVALRYISEVTDACGEVVRIFDALDSIVAASPVSPSGTASITTTIIAAHIDDYIFGHGG